MTADANPTEAPGGGVLRRVLAALPALTLLAVLTITASAEYQLARTVLDLRPEIAWALPAAIDSYVLAALHTRRDVPPAIAVMAGALLASMGAHLAQFGRAGTPLPVTWTAPLATAIMTVLVVVAWRVHVLIGPEIHPAATEAATDTPEAQPPAVPVSVQPVRVHDRLAVTAVSVDGSVTTTSARTTPAREETSAAARSRARTPTDAEILAMVGDQAPTIRALMREHGIGQSRATRLHRSIQAHQTATTPGTTTTEGMPEQAQSADQENDHQNQEPSTAATTENDQNQTSEELTNENTDISKEEEPQESESKGMSDTHTCITDRVGNSRSPKNGVDRGLKGETQRSSAGSTDFADVPLDLNATTAAGARGGR